MMVANNPEKKKGDISLAKILPASPRENTKPPILVDVASAY